MSEQHEYEVLATFRIKAPSIEDAEKAVNTIFEETKTRLKTNYTFKVQVVETE